MIGDRGSATVVATGLLAAVVVLGVVLAAVAGLIADRAAARNGADLAALAGAHAARREPAGHGDPPCEVAERAAELNGVRLTSCHTFGDDSVQVTVASGRAKASARAGPSHSAGQGPGGARAEGAEPPPDLPGSSEELRESPGPGGAPKGADTQSSPTPLTETNAPRSM